MRFRCPALILGLGLVSSCLTGAVAHAQRVTPSAEGDGLVHVALTLEAQGISVRYPPDLSVDDRDHDAILSGAVGSRVGVGTLEGHRALRIGSIAPDVEVGVAAEDASPPTSPGYTLWLVRNAQGWELEAQSSGNGDVETIPLSHRATETSAMRFTASIHATAAAGGALSLRWGPHVWRTDFRFDARPPRPPRPRVSGRGTARQADTDTTDLVRRTTLGERNESALVLPDGARISMLYRQGVGIEDEDYPRLATTGDGEVLRLVRAPVLRLKTDVSLRFGQTDVPVGNLAPGYAGAYGVWLRRVGPGLAVRLQRRARLLGHPARRGVRRR